MVFEPEVAIISGRITEIGKDYIWLWPGTRVTLLPGVDAQDLSPGVQVKVRAIRRHGQYVAESIEQEVTPDRPWLTPSSG